MVKTSEPSTTTLLDNNGDPICRSHQASDDDASNINDFNKKSQNGGNTSFFDLPGSSNTSTINTSTSTSSGHLTVEKYILQLQQKDERIRTLKDENKRLRSTLLSKTSEFQIRVDELVTELERQAEIVKKLQNELAICRRSAANNTYNESASRDLVSKKLSASGSFISHNPSYVSPKSTNISPYKNIKTNDLQTDDILAKLQSFNERNGVVDVQKQQQQIILVDHNLEETENQQQQQQNLIPIEQLCKMISENPATLLPAAALIFGKGGGTFYLKEENEYEEDKVEEEQNTNFEGQDEQQTQDAAEAAANLISFLMESTNNSNNLAVDPTPTSSFASTSTFHNDSIPQQNFSSHRRSKSRRNSTNSALPETPSQRQLQQNLDFEEVMQRVIGEAMNGGSSKKSINPSNHLSKNNVGTKSNGNTPHTSTVKPFTPEEQKLANEIESRIDANILKIENCHLNTTELALQCTRVMREYGIGQRLFARTSQGSLSELLSKPRPWNKLTDKGRDSFRRIYGWISDDIVIDLLCQLNHRKGACPDKVIHPDPQTFIASPESNLDGETTTAPIFEPPTLVRRSKDTLSDHQHQRPSKSLSPSRNFFDPPFAPTQAQIDKYSSFQLDIEDIARRMREFMSKNAISQSQIGDNGSVSDLLGRPKPWNILTSKGREPYVRMYLFLEQQQKRSENQGENGRIEQNINDDLDSQKSLDLRLEDTTEDSSSTKGECGDENELNEEEEEEGKEEMRAEGIDGNEDQCEDEGKGGDNEENRGEKVKRTTSCTSSSDDQPAAKKPKRTTETSATTENNPLDQIDTADVARRIRECLARSGISQRAFAEHLLKMTSGGFSDLLTKARPWVMLGWKHRQAYQIMVEFLADPDAVERLRDDERHRYPLITATSTLQIVSNLANELGVNTPIGTILKKANSPNPAISTSNGVHNNTSANKRKLSTPTSINNNNNSLIKSTTTATTNPLNASAPPSAAKRLPRFQRTIITDRQKEALIFIYIHEQRPNSKLIEQLAAKVGLQPRTVNNWFHNHRTRNKEKQVKTEGGEEEIITTIKTSHSTTPTPAQVLSRALNATDTKTTKWFRELAELLHVNNENITATTTYNNNQDLSNYYYLSNILKNDTKNEGISPPPNKILKEEPEQTTGNNDVNNSPVSSPSASTNINKTSNSLLDRAIARMHNRIKTESV
uniref:Homeobox protein cut-like n=1 Tax=Meloidogyne javanica TaxID=6303 RepID=A0A915MNW6_MELJA